MSLKKKDEIIYKILDYCSVQRKIKDITVFLNKNQNNVRSYYVYPILKKGLLRRTNKKNEYIKV
jgi:predicted transcriptional regulator